MMLGRNDPTMKIDGDLVIRATRTPEGPGTERISCTAGVVEVEAWGHGAGWLLENAPRLLGSNDPVEGFAPSHPVVRGFHRGMPGLRLGRSDAVFEALVPTILSQKVTGLEAARSYRALVLRFSEPAPGPGSLRLPPDPSVLRDIPYHSLHPLGIERKRAEVIRRTAAYAARMEQATSMESSDARHRITALPGIGAWTAAIVMRTALGDADAVETGDFHLPNTIAWHLAGEARADDERMLELLEPFRGQRGRVIRLVESGGGAAPKRGPRLAPMDHSRR